MRDAGRKMGNWKRCRAPTQDPIIVLTSKASTKGGRGERRTPSPIVRPSSMAFWHSGGTPQISTSLWRSSATFICRVSRARQDLWGVKMCAFSLFLPASRMALPQDPSTCCLALAARWHHSARAHSPAAAPAPVLARRRVAGGGGGGWRVQHGTRPRGRGRWAAKARAHAWAARRRGGRPRGRGIALGGQLVACVIQPHGKVRARPGPSSGALGMTAPYKRHGGNDATRSLRV